MEMHIKELATAVVMGPKVPRRRSYCLSDIPAAPYNSVALQGLDRLHEVVSGHLQFFEGDVTGSAEAETVHTEHLAVEAHILVPEARDACFHSHALGARRRQHLGLVRRELLPHSVELIIFICRALSIVHVFFKK